MIQFFYTDWIWIPGVIMIMIYSVIYFLEWKHPRLQLPHVNHSAVNWLQGMGFVLMNIISSYVMSTFLLNISVHFKGALGFIEMPYWVKFALSFLLLDVLIYSWHRINHIFPSLWKAHELHHQEKELSIFSTFHFSPKEILYSTIWKSIVYPLLGILPEAFFIYNAVFFLIILFHHSNFKLSYLWDRILSSVIVTPGLHHLHHSVILKESNSNYGSVFSFWDKMFGSATMYEEQKIEYGVKNLGV